MHCYTPVFFIITHFLFEHKILLFTHSLLYYIGRNYFYFALDTPLMRWYIFCVNQRRFPNKGKPPFYLFILVALADEFLLVILPKNGNAAFLCIIYKSIPQLVYAVLQCNEEQTSQWHTNQKKRNICCAFSDCQHLSLKSLWSFSNSPCYFIQKILKLGDTVRRDSYG